MDGRQSTELRVLMAGGGTGGHVFPALAVAQVLVGRGCEVSWVGREQGMERQLVESAGIPFHALPARPWLGKGLIAKLRALIVLALSAFRARRLISGAKIDVTVGTGGYVSGPAILGGFLARRPVLLLEPNAQAGMANRFLSRFSTAACTGYEETGAQLSCRAYWTGTPVRREFFESAATAEGLPGMLIVGGSQGAQQINRLLPAVVENLAAGSAPLRVVHQCGASHLAAVEADYAARRLAGVEVEVVPFIEDMAAAMHSAAIIVSRAGALTLAEITAAGRPSVLIPLAAAAGHQRANAEQLSAAGAAVLIGSDEATEDVVSGHLATLLANEELRGSMAEAARRLSRHDAAERIADLVDVLGRAA